MATIKDLTVITVTRNNLPGLVNTHLSLHQVEDSFTWIIKDGGSTDGTLEYLESINCCQFVLDLDIDHGIFDGMNIALSKVRTEYVWFLNSGDTLYLTSILIKCLEQMNTSGSNWLVAGALLESEEGKLFGYWETPTFPRAQRLLGIQSWCHQATIYRTAFLRQHRGYDADNVIADWSTALLLESIEKPLILVDPLATFLVGGVSSNIPAAEWIRLHTQGREWAGQLFFGSRTWDLVISSLTYVSMNYSLGRILLRRGLVKWAINQRHLR